MSRVDEIYRQIGDQSAPSVSVVSDENGTLSHVNARYRLTKKDLIKALEKMPDNAAIWNTVPGEAPEGAKRAIRDALWATLEPAVKTMILTPVGEYIESK